ncbi:MAG: hypothetical protein AB9879_14040 [Methanothrix sp.]
MGLKKDHGDLSFSLAVSSISRSLFGFAFCRQSSRKTMHDAMHNV